MAKTIIEINDLRREFKMGGETLQVLKGINLNIYEGEFVTIMGPSGSGKSTLLNILGCLDRPTSGDYILDGISVKNMSKNELANVRNTKIGFIFQAYNLLARTSAIENVELPLMYNPKIVAHSVQDAALADGEGCLSVDREVPGYVVRHARVTVDYFDKDGEKHRIKLKGYNSIVVQHEIDHINGIMFYDRINEKDPFAVKDGLLILE